MCPKAFVPCENKHCYENVPRDVMEIHLKKWCTFKPEKCDFCGIVFDCYEFDSHDENCPEELLYCDDCGDLYARKNKVTHDCKQCLIKTIELLKSEK